MEADHSLAREREIEGVPAGSSKLILVKSAFRQKLSSIDDLDKNYEMLKVVSTRVFQNPNHFNMSMYKDIDESSTQ